MIFPPNPEDYEILHQIGHNAISDLYSARCKTNNQLISIRIISMERSPIDVVNLRKGGSLWLTSSHENLSRYYGSFEVGSTLWVISEYIDGGSIRDILRYGYHHGIKNEILISAILRPVLEFLSIFHQNMHIHRAINSDVIFIKTDGTVKISNLSFASSLIKDGKRKGALFSFSYGLESDSSCYAAPEVLSGSGYTQSSDIWSVGITAIELATGILPYEQMTEMERIKSIIDGAPPTIQSVRAAQFSTQSQFDLSSSTNVKTKRSSSSKEIKLSSNSSSNNACEFSPAFIDFIDQCLKKSPDKRPSVNRLLEHKFFKNMAVNLNFNLNSNNNNIIKSYISRVLMSQLPPLHERFSSLNAMNSKNYFENKNVLINKSESTRGVHFIDNIYGETNQAKSGQQKQISAQKSAPNLPRKANLSSSNTYGFLFSSDERPKMVPSRTSSSGSPSSVLKEVGPSSSSVPVRITTSNSYLRPQNIGRNSENASLLSEQRSYSWDEINEPLFPPFDNFDNQIMNNSNSDENSKGIEMRNSDEIEIERSNGNQSSVQVGRFTVTRKSCSSSLPKNNTDFLDN